MPFGVPDLSFLPPKYSFAAGASRAYEAGERTNEQLGRTLAEIDGLFAGLNYLEKTEPRPRASPSSSGPISAPEPSPVDSLQRDLDLLQSNAAPTHENEPEHSHDSKSHDWAAMRNIRDGMELTWKIFEKMATELNNDANNTTVTKNIVNMIRSQYGDAKGLWEAGVFAHRHTVTGPIPNDLNRIFALTSLSYVVSGLLCRVGRIAEQDVLAGIEIWCHAIQCPEERDTFMMLANRLWPEARRRLSKTSFNLAQERGQKGPAFRNYQWNSAGSVNPDMMDGPVMSQETTFAPIPTQMLPPTGTYAMDTLPAYETYDAHTNTWPGTSINPSQALQDYVYGTTNATSDAFGFESFLSYTIPFRGSYEGPPAFLTTNHTNPADPALPLEMYLPTPVPTNLASGDPARTKIEVSAESLRETKVFKVLLEFFKYINHLTFALAGYGLTAQGLESLFTYLQKKPHVRDRIYKEFMGPILAESKSRDLAYQAIASTAEKFVDLGHLQSIALVKTYMQFAGMAIIDRTEFNQFAEWIVDFQAKRPVRKPTNPYPCSYCRKGFARKYNVRRHESNCPRQRARRAIPAPNYQVLSQATAA